MSNSSQDNPADTAGSSPLAGLEDIVSEFLIESHENLDQLDRDLVALEQDPTSRDLLSGVFRTIHTIKGTSGFLGFGTLESVTHVGESLLARLRDGKLTLTPGTTTILLDVVDAVRDLLATIEQHNGEAGAAYDELVARVQHVLDGGSADEAAAPAAEAPAETAAETPAETVAEEVAEPVAEPVAPEPVAPEPVAAAPVPAPAPTLAAVPSAVEEEHHEAPVAQVAPDAAGGEPRRSVADSTIRVDVGLLDSLMTMVGELVLTRNQMLQRAAATENSELAHTTHRLNLIVGELQEGVMKTRLQPIDNVWSKLPRVVRDLSVQLGKHVDLKMEGRETELDKTILEAIRDPLTHLVRNSIDHGIEGPETRAAAGKTEKGTLTLRAFHEGGQVNLEISDDGKGIDPAALKAKAIGKGLVTEEKAARMTDHEAVQLIFLPGFSTAAAVTNVSGRGVGMDVVRTNIEKIGGTIDIVTAHGEGTTVRVRIPLTLAIIPALVVTSAEHRYAIPQVNLLELVRLDAEQSKVAIETVHGAPVYRLRGKLLPLVDLREQLGLEAREPGATYIVVLQADNQEYGLVVDDILDTEEIVVKPLSSQLRSLSTYSGATIMGDGSVALILDVTAIARSSGMNLESGEDPSVANIDLASAESTSVLVVDVGSGRRAAIPVAAVDRLEEMRPDRVERAGQQEVVQYRGQILPMVWLANELGTGGAFADPDSSLRVVVCRSEDQLLGVVVDDILDIVESDLAVRIENGGSDSAVVQEHVTELVDIAAIAARLTPAPSLAWSA
ncbi:chemotaxis protein CheA [Nocardioides bruguierae]|uniref:chemotaxis protein CheA n=1 Tax=Nocardioides bruguierae TaxID=2945102 RepID=UPI00201FBA2E|nr:chemotaxis protein CheA [Nocardioides bruguierae]MCL8027650.1 chemotaxis protein CheA [Nocardioides bruguierae]